MKHKRYLECFIIFPICGVKSHFLTFSRLHPWFGRVLTTLSWLLTLWNQPSNNLKQFLT